MIRHMTGISEAKLWERIVLPDRPDLPADLARYVLGLGFEEADHERMAELSRRANQGTLAEAERAELEEFVAVGHVLALLQSKARRSLRSVVAGRPA